MTEEKHDTMPGHDGKHPNDQEGHQLFIFVNRRRFDRSQGVREAMTGGEIAALADVPADVAVVRRDSPHGQEEIPVGKTVRIHSGDQFFVTRRHVDGG